MACSVVVCSCGVVCFVVLRCVLLCCGVVCCVSCCGVVCCVLCCGVLCCVVSFARRGACESDV